MPKRDLHAKYDQVVISLAGSFTHSGSGVSFQVVGNVQCYSRYAFDASLLLYGIRLTYGGAQGTGPNPVGTKATCDIPILGLTGAGILTHTVHATNLVSGNTRVEIDNLKIFSTAGGGWYVVFDELRWYVDGTLRHTEAGTDVSSTSSTPAGLPFFGIPFYWAPGADFTPQPSHGDLPGTSSTPGTVVNVSCATTLTGAWTVEDDYTSGAEGFPVETALLAVPSVECPCPAATLPDVDVTNTGSIELTAEGTYQVVTTYIGEIECPCSPDPDGIPSVQDVWSNELEWITKGSNILTIPAGDCELIRFDPDNHREIVYRYGFPLTQRTATGYCQTAFPATESGDIVQDTDTVDLHPRQSEYLARVGGTTHAFEDTLGYALYSPCGHSATKYTGTRYTTVETQPSACQVGSSALCDPNYAALSSVCYNSKVSSSVVNIDEWADNPDMDLDMMHAETIAIYVNKWGSRLRQYSPVENVFPPDEDEDGQDTWPVFAAKVLIDYWKAKGDQWQSLAGLPEADNTLARTTLINAPLLFDEGARRWGDATYRVIDFEPDTSYTYVAGDSGIFTLTDCSGAYGAQITLTPDPGEMQIIFEIALGHFADRPYLYPHIVKQFTLGWEAANVDNILVELVSVDGSVVELTDNVEGTFDRPTGEDAKYAGDYVQDYGCGFFTDQGADLRPNGESTAYMANAEQVHALCLLGGRTAATLRFTIDVLDDEEDIILDYPVIIADTTDAKTFQENRAQVAIVWASGTGIRLGNACFFDNGTHSATPTIYEPGYWFDYPGTVPTKGYMVPTGVDVLTLKRLLCTIEAYNNNFATEIGTIWDALEATDAEELDGTTIAHWIPSDDQQFPRGAVCSVVSCAPVCGAPRRARDANYQPTGTWKQEAYSFAVEPRFHVGDQTTHVVNPDDSSTWTSTTTSVTGWPATKHSHAVTNEEGLFQIKRGTVAIGTMRPWGGSFTVRNTGEVVEGYPGLKTDVGLDKRRISVWLDGDDFVKSDIRDGSLNIIAAIDLGIEAQAVNISIDRQAHPATAWLFTQEAGSLYFRISTNGGFTYGSATLIGTGMHLAADIGLGGTRYLYWYESGAIKGRRYDRAGTALEAAFTAIASADDNSFDVTVLPIAGGKNNVVIDYVVGGTKTTVTSQDGVTF